MNPEIKALFLLVALVLLIVGAVTRDTRWGFAGLAAFVAVPLWDAIEAL